MVRRLPSGSSGAPVAPDLPLATGRGSEAGPEAGTPAAPKSGRGAAPVPPRDRRRRFRAACLLGGLLALIPQVALLLGGGFSERNPLSGFYDAQAHSFLDLRWDVPADVLSIEAFVVDGRAYMYFGPTPALLRLPVAAVTDHFDGRLTSVSLLLASVVALIALTDLSWRVRQLVAGDRPVTRVDLLVAGSTTFLLGAGTTLLFLSSAPVVYHEAIAWGVALALAADAALLAYVAGRRPGALAAAGVLATLAVLARPSVGLGPVLALGLLLAVEVVVAVRSRRGSGRRPRHLEALAVATGLPVLLYALVNVAKFGSAFGVPWQAQALSQFDPARQGFLRESGGTLFGARYAPTTLLQYVRPDALSFHRSFPWVDFPGPADRLFDVPFDVVDRCSSLVATMPWLVLLAAVGVVALVRRRSPGTQRAAAALWAPVLGALAATPVTLGIAYIASRYLADFLPLLLLPALVGVQLLVPRPGGPRRAGLGAVVAGGAAVAVLVNVALAVQYQGLYGPATGETQRAHLVRWQSAMDDFLPGDQAPDVRRLTEDDPLPDHGEATDLVVIGDCAGLYQHDGSVWRPVERTGEVGRVRVRTRLDAPGPGGSSVLLLGGRDGGARSLAVEVQDDGRAVFALRIGARTIRGNPVEVDGGERVVDAVFDRRLHGVAITVDDRVVVGDTVYGPPDDEVVVAPDWPAPVTVLPNDTQACEGVDG